MPLLIVALVGMCCEAQDQRQNPQQLPVKPNPQRPLLQKQAPQGAITCGSEEDLINRIDACAAPLMDILQGTITKWPRNDAEIGDLCQSVSVSTETLVLRPIVEPLM